MMAGEQVVVQAIELHHVRVTPRTVWSFIALTMTDNSTGWGEASWSPEPTVLDTPARNMATLLKGQPMEAVEQLVAAQAILSLPQAAVISALEQACWDLRGQRLGQAAAWLRGSPQRTQVQLYANINRRTVDRTPAGFEASAQHALAAGYRSLKIAPFDGITPTLCNSAPGRQLLDVGLARTAAVCDAARPYGAQVFVDCHWRFDVTMAFEALRALAALGVSWFECPLPELPQHMRDLCRLRTQANRLGLRTAGLEELTHPEAFRPWLEADCYDIVMPDVKYAGGISGLLQVADLAAHHGVVCVPHNPSGPVCHAASLAACAMGRGMDLLEHQYGETPAFYELVDGAIPAIRQGLSDLLSGPGLGVRLTPSAWHQYAKA